MYLLTACVLCCGRVENGNIINNVSNTPSSSSSSSTIDRCCAATVAVAGAAAYGRPCLGNATRGIVRWPSESVGSASQGGTGYETTFFLSRSRCSVLFFSRERDRAVETRGHIPLVYHKLYILAFGTKHYFCKTMYQSVRVNFVSSCQASL